MCEPDTVIDASMSNADGVDTSSSPIPSSKSYDARGLNLLCSLVGRQSKQKPVDRTISTGAIRKHPTAVSDVERDRVGSPLQRASITKFLDGLAEVLSGGNHSLRQTFATALVGPGHDQGFTIYVSKYNGLDRNDSNFLADIKHRLQAIATQGRYPCMARDCFALRMVDHCRPRLLRHFEVLKDLGRYVELSTTLEDEDKGFLRSQLFLICNKPIEGATLRSSILITLVQHCHKLSSREDVLPYLQKIYESRRDYDTSVSSPALIWASIGLIAQVQDRFKTVAEFAVCYQEQVRAIEFHAIDVPDTMAPPPTDREYVGMLLYQLPDDLSQRDLFGRAGDIREEEITNEELDALAADLNRTPEVHPEMQMAAFLSKNDHTLDEEYIGLSTKPCFLCSMMLKDIYFLRDCDNSLRTLGTANVPSLTMYGPVKSRKLLANLDDIQRYLLELLRDPDADGTSSAGDTKDSTTSRANSRLALNRDSSTSRRRFPLQSLSPATRSLECRPNGARPTSPERQGFGPNTSNNAGRSSSPEDPASKICGDPAEMVEDTSDGEWVTMESGAGDSLGEEDWDNTSIGDAETPIGK